MGRNYKQITLEERCQITQLHAAGCKVREIAAALDRAPSTIARELKRNGSRTKCYEPSYAQQQARARRWSGCWLERDQGLREAVLSRLAQGWSPEQVAGRLSREAGRRVISHESIYRFIYAQIRRTNAGSWRHYLPRAKSKRGYRGRRGGSPASFIKLRRPLSERPQEVVHRQSPRPLGSRSDDVPHPQTGGPHPPRASLPPHHRRPATQQGRSARRPGMRSILAQLPPRWRRSVAFDNGTEFAHHYRLHVLGLETFFCDTHSP